MTDHEDFSQEPLDGDGIPASPYRPSMGGNRPSESLERPTMSISGMLAWAVVLIISAGLTSLIAVQQFFAANEIGGNASKTDLMQVEIQIRALVGQENLNKFLGVPDAAEVTIPPELDTGCYEQRLCYAIAKNEFAGPNEAQQYMDQLANKVEEHDLELTEEQQQMRDTLAALFYQYESEKFDVGTIPEQQQAQLKERLGFCGKLALLPEGTPNEQERESMIESCVLKLTAMSGVAIVGFGAMGVGFVIAIVAIALFFMGKIRSGMPSFITDHNIYIETFAWWIVLFLGGSIIPEIATSNPRWQLALQPVVFLGSLICLAWPLIRGVTLEQLRTDIGWRADRPLLEVLWSPVTYVTTLPVLVPGLILIALGTQLMSLFQTEHEFAREAAPSHPIQELLAAGELPVIGLVLITACICAPIVEETVFRGILYRHLRHWSSRWRIATSVIFSVLINAFIFAALHPQGIVAIPVLMSLAVCFSLAREWRGNLVAPMMMHGIHNTAVTCFSLLVL